MKKLILYIIIAIIGVFETHAQQIPQFRHNMFGNFYCNPAYAMDSYKPEIIINHRSQWVGFEGSPITSSIAGSFSFHQNMAFGLITTRDKTGPINHTLINLNYAYQLQVDANWKLSMGIAWTLMQSAIDGSLIDLYEDGDETVIENISDKVWKPDANAGILLSNKTYFMGFSVMQLFESKYRLYHDRTGELDSERHYFLSSGAHLPLGRRENTSVHPYLNMEFVNGAPFSFDAGGMFEFNKSLIFGLSYSIKDAITLNFGYKSNDLSFIYSYDIVVSHLMSNARGAHEITLSYDINTSTQSLNRPLF